jgi:hypothetical protein
MTKVFGLFIAATLLAPVAGVCGQSVDVVPASPIEELREVYPVGYPPRDGYSSRAIGTVYNNGGEANTNTNGLAYIGMSSWGDEMRFDSGPWAGVGTRLATEVIVWIQSSGVNCPTGTTQQYDILVDMYADADHDYTANPMLINTPLASFRVAVNATCGVQTGWIVNLTGAPGGGVLIPSNAVFIKYRLVEPGTETFRTTGSNGPTFGIGTTLVGTSTPSFAADVNVDKVFAGAPTPIVGFGANANEHRISSTAIPRNQRGRLRGDIPPPPEPTHEDLGTLTDAGLTITRPLAPGATNWYKFTINNGAMDAPLTFLDVDAEGSVAANVSMGLYTNGATLVGFDHDEGSGLLPQLTFGVGRRAAVGDGRQYDGRDAQLQPGTYFLAVSSGNASFADAYSVSNPGTDTGDITVRFATNVNGTPAAPSVSPAGPTVTQVGQILSPGAQTTAQTPAPRDTVWYALSICAPASGDNYLDVDFSMSTASADTEAFLFDANGNLVVQNDDADADNAAPFYLLSQLSFGNTGPRPAFHANARPFAGDDGNLPVGTYYLGVGLFNTTELANAATNGRFHLRGASGSALPVTLTFYTNMVECAPTCGNSDFNGDGDFGTDQDIEAFFACLAGNCCATCWPGGSDFNGDGDFGTDQDIESFFRVLAGGPC